MFRIRGIQGEKMSGAGRRHGLINIMTIPMILHALVPARCDRESTGPRPDLGLEGSTEEEISEPGTNTPGPGEGESLVHICGRSVLEGWFEHCGRDHDPEKPVAFRGHRLLFHETESTPGIADNALRVMEGMEPGEALFFRLRFEDFASGDGDTARSNLEDSQGIVDMVTRAALYRGLVVLPGNSFPTVAEYTDPWLAWNHRQYNHHLERLASEYPGQVGVVGLYGVLASPDGSPRRNTPWSRWTPT